MMKRLLSDTISTVSNKFVKHRPMDVEAFYHPLVMIFEKLDLKDLINLELVSKKFREIVRKNKWSNLIIRFSRFDIIQYVLKNYLFANYDFTYSNISKTHLQYLEHCWFINIILFFSFCHIILNHFLGLFIF